MSLATLTLNGTRLRPELCTVLYGAIAVWHEQLEQRVSDRKRTAQEQLEDRNVLGLLEELRAICHAESSRSPAETWAAVLDGLAVLAAAETIGVAMRDRPRELVALHAEQRSKLLAALRCLLGEVAP